MYLSLDQMTLDLVNSVGYATYASLVSASTDRNFKPGSKYWVYNTACPQQGD